MDLVISNESPSEISDAIKSILFAKSAEKIEGIKPFVASSLFGLNDEEEYDEE